MGNLSFSMSAKMGDDDGRDSYGDDLSWKFDELKEGDCLEQEHTVLIVDDDEMFLKAIKNDLKRRVSAVYTAQTPAAALSILGSLPTNILVCDYDLGRADINGVELVSLLRKKFPNIKRALICSGSHPSEIPTSHHVDDVVNKTSDLDKLRLLVQKPF
jgi:CheY-like chemotaxis protein